MTVMAGCGDHARRCALTGMVWVRQAGHCESQVEGLVEAEAHALAVGSLELFLAEGGAHRVEAVSAVARFGFLPGLPRSLPKGLRDAMGTAARCQSPVSADRHAGPRLAPAMPDRSPLRRLTRRAVSKRVRAPPWSLSWRSTQPRLADTKLMAALVACIASPACSRSARAAGMSPALSA
jgi:hypothetical protein